jgi:hypothetical protein
MRRLGVSTVPVLLATALLIIGFFVAGVGVGSLVAREADRVWFVVVGLVGFACRLMMVGVYVGDAGGQTVVLPVRGTLRGEKRPWRMPGILPAGELDRLLAEPRHLTATGSSAMRSPRSW